MIYLIYLVNHEIRLRKPIRYFFNNFLFIYIKMLTDIIKKSKEGLQERLV